MHQHFSQTGAVSNYSYREVLKASEKNNWRVEDLIGGDKRLDFSKPFMPESLARVQPLDFLTPEEQLKLNQIRGYGYLSTFVVAEGFILPYVLDHARPHLNGDDYRVRALLRFATEEAKHTHLFRRFCEEFEAGFGTPCEIIGPAEDVAREVLSHHPLGVGLAILQIEWTTQAHYLESVRDNQTLDPVFKDMLKHHWLEEAQHTKSDTLLVEALADSCSPEEIDRAFEEYLEIGGILDEGFCQQVQLDLASFISATGRELNPEEREQFIAVQTQAVRWTYLGTGMTHEKFLRTVDALRPGARRRVEEIAPTFC